MRYSYNNLKSNSKRRGKEFTLTFEEFKNFAIRVNYLEKKGITKLSYHIDRIDETKGYTISNIQLLTNSANIRKYREWRGSFENKNNFVVITDKIEPISSDDCPF